MGLFDLFRGKPAPKAAARPQPRPQPGMGPGAARPDPKARNNLVVVILDSCRFDTFVEADPKTIRRLGELERRYTYASWTAPSHYNLLTGLLPHTTPPNVYASDLFYPAVFGDHPLARG